MTDSWRQELKKLLKEKETAGNKKNHKLIAKHCETIGRLLFENGFCEEAVEQFKEMATIYNDISSKLDYANALHLISDVYSETCNLESALTYAKKYYDVSREIASVIELQRATTTLGRVYFLVSCECTNETLKNENLQRSLEYYSKSQNLLKSLAGTVSKNDILEMRACLLLNLANIHEILKNTGEAEKMYRDCANFSQAAFSQDTEIKALIAISNIKFKKREFSESFSFAFECIRCVKRCRDKSLQFIVYFTLGKIQLFQAKFSESARYFKFCNSTLQLADEENLREFKLFVSVCCECYNSQKQILQDASEHSKKLFSHKIALSLFKIKAYEMSLKYFLTEKSLIKEENMNKDNYLLRHIGDCYYFLSNYSEAIIFYAKCLESNSDNSETAMTRMSYAMCNFYLQSASSSEVIKMLKDALLLIPSNNLSLKNRYLENLKVVYERNNMTNELEETKKMIELEDNDSQSLCSESSMSDFERKIHEFFNQIPNTEQDGNNRNLRRTRKTPCNNPNRKNELGESRLHIACIKGDLESAKALVENGAEVNARDNCGWLPIHEAANHGFEDIVNFLIENGSYINDRGGISCQGVTPLIDAADNMHLKVINVLLDHGADPAIQDDDNRTILSILSSKSESFDDIKKIQEIISKIRNRTQKTAPLIFKDIPKIEEKLPKSLNNRSSKLDALSNHRIPLFMAVESRDNLSTDIELISEKYQKISHETSEVANKANKRDLSHKRSISQKIPDQNKSNEKKNNTKRRRATVLSSDDDQVCFEAHSIDTWSNESKNSKSYDYYPQTIRKNQQFTTIYFEDSQKSISCASADVSIGLDLIKLSFKSSENSSSVFDNFLVDSSYNIIHPSTSNNDIKIHSVIQSYNISRLSSFETLKKISEKTRTEYPKFYEKYIEPINLNILLYLSIYKHEKFIKNLFYVLLHKKITKFNLSGLKIEDDELLKIIGQTLPFFSNLENLNLSNMGLNFDRLKILIEPILNQGGLETLKFIDLSFNHVETSHDELSLFFKNLFTSCPNISDLSLIYCGFTGFFDSCLPFTSIAQECSKLISLDLSCNNFENSQIFNLFKYFLPWNEFKFVALSNISPDQDIFLPLVSFLKMSKVVISNLNISCNKLTHTISSLLTLSSFTENLISLDISNSKINSSTALLLKRELIKMKKLKYLYLYDNPEFFNSYDEIFEFLHSICICKSLQSLDISSTIMIDESISQTLTPSIFVDYCNRELKNSEIKLSKIYLRGNKFTIDSIMKYIELFNLNIYKPTVDEDYCILELI